MEHERRSCNVNTREEKWRVVSRETVIVPAKRHGNGAEGNLGVVGWCSTREQFCVVEPKERVPPTT